MLGLVWILCSLGIRLMTSLSLRLWENSTIIYWSDDVMYVPHDTINLHNYDRFCECLSCNNLLVVWKTHTYINGHLTCIVAYKLTLDYYIIWCEIKLIIIYDFLNKQIQQNLWPKQRHHVNSGSPWICRIWPGLHHSADELRRSEWTHHFICWGRPRLHPAKEVWYFWWSIESM